ncbi:MAG TPA: Rieske (2Fe-2S) protein [Bacteroidota bacterium]|nr:Rieske (2Fe-2S) protein [Bacteroidota bacterium]
MNEQTGLTRRSFLGRILLGWIGVMFIPALYVVARYIVPPALREKIAQVLNVGNLSDIPVNSAKIIKFNKTPIVVVRTPEDQVKAFSAVCTHLGCIVEYRNDDNRFHCNCHGSVFDINGRNIAGPAPRPLDPLRVEIKDNHINILKS